MALNFGPINRAGGARRLNVAVTRARYLLKLVASIQPEDIDLTRANSQGALLLRKFLETARDGVKAALHEEKDQAAVQFESLFEESVRHELSQRGLEVVPQVGVSQYRIDLAVLDPDQRGRYLLGIECDGPIYRSAMTARDRDRLRQQVLEGLGWKIHRIWSRDWIQNREQEIAKVLRVIELRRKELNSNALPQQSTRDEATAGQVASPGAIEPQVIQSPPAAVPFRRFQPGTLLERPGENLLDASLSDIVDAFQAIANAEGPVSLNKAKSLLLEAWKARRTKQHEERLDSAIQHGQQQKAFAINDKFLWPLGMKIAPLRVHLAGEPARPLKDIAPQEIEVAVRECVKGAVTIAP